MFNKYKFWQFQGSSVTMVIRFWVDDPWFDYQKENIFLFCRATILAVGHPASCSIGTRGSFPRGCYLGIPSLGKLCYINGISGWSDPIVLRQWLRVSKCYRTQHCFRMLGSSDQVTQCHNWDKQNLQKHHCKNPKGHIYLYVKQFI